MYVCKYVSISKGNGRKEKTRHKMVTYLLDGVRNEGEVGEPANTVLQEPWVVRVERDEVREDGDRVILHQRVDHTEPGIGIGLILTRHVRNALGTPLHQTRGKRVFLFGIGCVGGLNSADLVVVIGDIGWRPSHRGTCEFADVVLESLCDSNEKCCHVGRS